MSTATTNAGTEPRRPLLRFAVWCGAVLSIGAALGSALIPPRDPNQRLVEHPAPPAKVLAELKQLAAQVDQAIAKGTTKHDLNLVGPAPELTIMRRLSLGLRGTIPALEEIRLFEQLPSAERLDWWISDLLADRRTSDFLAERFVRAWVGVEDGPVLFFRRRRLVNWTSDQLLAQRPYDELVRELVAANGIWTDHPAVNFLSVTIDNDDPKKLPQPNRLAATTARAFLGVRLDCAECHDHPFDERWKQSDFQGLAAFFGQARTKLDGIDDDPKLNFTVEDRKTLAKSVKLPRVPYADELLPQRGTRRERLATWLTSPENPLFARAVVNRVWAIVLGRPLVDPLDDLPTWDLSAAGANSKQLQVTSVEFEKLSSVEQVLDLLARDFQSHGYDLQRLIRAIAMTQTMRRSSQQPTSATTAVDLNRAVVEPQAYWAEFPLTRLRPDQVIGALTQAGSLRTIDEQTHILTRLKTYERERDFVKRYGDAGADEFNDRAVTIPQSLLLMNNYLVQEVFRPELLNASFRIARLSPDDETAIEMTYLVLLTRRPSPVEREHFLQSWQAQPHSSRNTRIEDLCWTLLNSTEFRWNH